MISIKINNKVLFKGEAGQWIARPPDEFRDAIKPGSKPAPYMKAIAITLSDALITGKDMTIKVTTGPGTWTMKVDS